MNRGDKLIFVGGVGRSGTTLLQNMLDSHPSILGGPQFGNIPDIIQLRDKLHERIKSKKTDIYNSCEDIDNHIRNLIEDLFAPLLRKSGCEYISEKTPHNITVFPELMELFPEAHFIHIVRDPRAVILSQLLFRERFKEKGIYIPYSRNRISDLIGLTGFIKERLLCGISIARMFPERVITVVYERLVSDPEGETKKICKYLGIEWSEEMLHPSRKKHLGEESMTRDGIWYTKKSYNRDMDKTCIDKWKTQLSLFKQILISFYFQDVEDLAQYGYDLSINSFKGKTLLAFISQIYQLNRMKVFRILTRPCLNFKIVATYEEKTHLP